MGDRRIFTVAQIEDRCRRFLEARNDLGDYSELATNLPSGSMIAYIDEAHAYAWDLYSDSDEGWNLVRATIDTSSGTGSLPPDAIGGKFRAFQVQDSSGGGFRTLDRATLDDDSYSGGSFDGLARCYRVLSDTFEVIPSGGSTSVRLTYVPCAPILSSSLQTIEGGNGFEQVTMLKACVLARIQEERDCSDIRIELRDVEARFRESIRSRDRGTPAHTRNPRRRTRDYRRRP